MNRTNKNFLATTFISLFTLGLFVARPLFAQTPPPVSGAQAQSGGSGTADDFDNDVKQGKDEINKDVEAQKFQKEVLDGEDGQAGEGDGQNDQEGVDEFGDMHQAEDNQGVNENDQDINNSDVDEVDDADNLDAQSQDVIDEHQSQDDSEEMNSAPEGESANPENENSAAQDETSNPEQGATDGQTNNP